MEQKNRKTLKSYFEKGDVPTEEQFAELIDSVPNIVDDGQVIRTKNGWAFYPSQDGKLDIDLHTIVGEPVVWKFSVTPEKDLLFKNGKEETILCLTQDKNVTLYGSLHIEGGETPIPSGEDYLAFPADKQWYDLPVDISREGFGCRVYSIHASFRERGTGLCRLTRATAIWLNYMEQRIESPEKHWWGWSGNIRLRWLLQEKKLHLQIRTNKRLPSGELHCRIVEMYKG